MNTIFNINLFRYTMLSFFMSSFSIAAECNNVSTNSELEACINKKVSYSEEQLSNEISSVKSRIMNNYVADLQLGHELIENIQDAQNAWLAYRDKTCKVVAFEIEKGTPAYKTVYDHCITTMNNERVVYLSEIGNSY